MSRPTDVPGGRVRTVLVAADDPDDRQLIREAFAATRIPADLRFVVDGEELLEYLLRRGRYVEPVRAPAPDLLLLDLNMPRKDGREALREIKAAPALGCLRIVILTTSGAEEDVRVSYALSATSYVTKPTSYRGLVQVVAAIARYWLEIVELPPSLGGPDGV